MLPKINGEMRVVADPELRFANSGTAIGTVRLVANSRKKNQAGEWEDDKVAWIKGVMFKQQAENMVESLTKGDLVVISGSLHTQEWETKEGEKRISVEVMLDHIGPSLQWATAKPVKSQRSNNSGSSSSGSTSSAPVDDPWASTSAQTDEPPF